jgi:hypothetical protein
MVGIANSGVVARRHAPMNITIDNIRPIWISGKALYRMIESIYRNLPNRYRLRGKIDREVNAIILLTLG